MKSRECWICIFYWGWFRARPRDQEILLLWIFISTSSETTGGSGIRPRGYLRSRGYWDPKALQPCKGEAHEVTCSRCTWSVTAPARCRPSSSGLRWGRWPPAPRTSHEPRQYSCTSVGNQFLLPSTRSWLYLHWQCLMRRSQLSTSWGSSEILAWAAEMRSGLIAMTNAELPDGSLGCSAGWLIYHHFRNSQVNHLLLDDESWGPQCDSISLACDGIVDV